MLDDTPKTCQVKMRNGQPCMRETQRLRLLLATFSARALLMFLTASATAMLAMYDWCAAEQVYISPLLKSYELAQDSNLDRTSHLHSPTVYCAEGMILLQSSYSNTVRTFAVGSPVETWQWRAAGGWAYLLPIVGETVLVASYYGANPGAITALGIADGNVRWRVDGSRGNWNYNAWAEKLEDRIIVYVWSGIEVYDYETGKFCGGFRYVGNGEVRRTDSLTVESAGEQRQSCTVAWGIDDRIFLINPFDGYICGGYIPDKNLRPVVTGDGYVGFGNVIEEVGSKPVAMVFRCPRRYDNLVVLDQRSWKVLWRSTALRVMNWKEDRGELFAVELGGQQIFRGVWCADLRTGEIKWKFNWNAADFAGLSVFDSVVYAVSNHNSDGYFRSRLYALSRSTGLCLWEDEFPGKFVGDPMICGDTVIVVSRVSAPGDAYYTVRLYEHDASDRSEEVR